MPKRFSAAICQWEDFSKQNAFAIRDSYLHDLISFNVLVFPGMGLGVLATGAREVRPEFFTAAAHAVAASVSKADLARGILYPPVAELRTVSRQVAQAVGKCAISVGASRPCAFATFRHENREERFNELLDRMGWTPMYLPLVPI